MKIGILATAYEVPRIESLLRYLRREAEVRVYVDEEEMVDSGNTSFDEQVMFTKGRGYALLTMARMAEAAGIPVVNSAHATWVATHRMMSSIACREGGVRVPEFSLAMSPPEGFDQVIVKNIVDQHHLRFLDRLPIVAGPRSTIPPIATAEEAGVSELAPRYHYYQRFLRTEFEYKVYGFGDTLLYYRQEPVLVNRDKMSTREQIGEVPALGRATRAAEPRDRACDRLARFPRGGRNVRPDRYQLHAQLQPRRRRRATGRRLPPRLGERRTPMRIAVLTKRRTGFCAVLGACAQRQGHELVSFDLGDLVVDDTLGGFDLVVIKSKQLYFLYAGFHAKALGVDVFPDPDICKQVSTRIERPFLAGRAGIATPRFYFASPQAVRERLAELDFPLVRKRIVGSGA